MDYLIKPVQPDIVRTRVHNLELLLARQALGDQNSRVEEKVQQRTSELVARQNTTIECLSSIAEIRAPETGNHIIRTNEIYRDDF